MFGQGDGLLAKASDWLDTPRQGLYWLADKGYHAAGGDPGTQINHFADALGAMGMDRDSLLTKGLGALGDVATDPLTYAGALGGWAGAKLLRGMIPFDVAQDASRAAKGAASLAEGAEFRAPLSKVPEFRDAGFASRANLEREGLADGAIARSPKGAEEGRQVVAIGAPNPVDEAFVGRVARGRNMDDAALQSRAHWMSGMGSETLDGAAGFYDPTSQSVVTRAGMDPAHAALNARHERIHAIIDQAAKAQDPSVAANLPALMRYPAQLMQGQSAFSRTAGRIGDELAAQTLEHRGLYDQMRGAASFLFNPEKNAIYAQRFAFPSQNSSAAAVGLYGALPTAFLGAGAAAGNTAAGGLGALARSLGEGG